MSERLKSLGFEIIGGSDLDRKSLVEALIRFGRAAETADVALFFYAGHGLQVSGQNYLVPIDGQVEYEAEVDISLVSLSGVMQQLERGSKTNIIFLDACRDNPFAKQLATIGATARPSSIAKGLGRVQTGSGTFVAFATQPDAVAADGPGRNSPFTTALLQHIDEPGRSISDLMIAVRNEVLAATAGTSGPGSPPRSPTASPSRPIRCATLVAAQAAGAGGQRPARLSGTASLPASGRGRQLRRL